MMCWPRKEHLPVHDYYPGASIERSKLAYALSVMTDDLRVGQQWMRPFEDADERQDREEVQKVVDCTDAAE